MGEKASLVKVKDVLAARHQSGKMLVVGPGSITEKYLREDRWMKNRQYICPTREDVAMLYRFLRQCGSFPFGYDMLWCRLRRINYCKMMICIDVMVELGLAETVPGAVRGSRFCACPQG